jgi:hypothetical protein
MQRRGIECLPASDVAGFLSFRGDNFSSNQPIVGLLLRVGKNQNSYAKEKASNSPFLFGVSTSELLCGKKRWHRRRIRL